MSRIVGSGNRGGWRVAVVSLIAVSSWCLPPPLLAQTDGEADAVEVVVSALDKNKADIAAREAEIVVLNQRIAELQAGAATASSDAELIAGQLKRVQQQLVKAELELQRTRLSIAAVHDERRHTETTIGELQAAVVRRREQLRELIRLLYHKERTPLINVWLGTQTLSEMLAERSELQALQDRSITVMAELREEEERLREEQRALEQQAEDLSQLNTLLTVQQQDLAVQRSEQQSFLQAKREEQRDYDQRLADAKAARAEIEAGLFALKNAGIELSLTQATDMARLAREVTGVRAALLLGVLKVESNLGNNIGGGSYPDDMHPASREPFLRITKRLGRDPFNTPISARPKSYQGWGGAMGPAQIMPQTWERIESRLAALLKKPQADPYELTDAFVGTAILLADMGAADAAREYEAVNRYLAGPNWQRFTWYGDRVLAIAKEYEREGL